ncbi:MAG TPA: quinolinate synthase NadA [Sedimentisphaerales bacterium]|jgi:quinolinate synthase|nr:quinolinate synthase NadA [Sedimentisphaerales bacterium]HNU28006.1 quinolinate synthase NadA [Sedimentisphaerales bacterium]
MLENELDQKLFDEIREWRDKRHAVILAHNYQPAEVQDVADFCGDSLGLSVQASKTDAEVIVFCGVRFMAETAKILSPGKTVLLPDRRAGCPMADMITAGQLRALKQKHPDALVVCYVNSTALVKAESDYCCTSSNAVAVVQSLPKDREILFVPDQHLGRFVEQQTGRRLILWPGYCPTHVSISEDDITQAKRLYPDAVVIAHPECSEPVKDLADALLSTGQMLKFVQNSPAKRFLVATEIGMIHPLKKARPDAEFIPASRRGVCPNMKKISLENVLASLTNLQFPMEVHDEVRLRAAKALERMVQIQPGN